MDSRVLEALSATFGFDELRPLQAEAIAAALEGRDALTVLPTGGGKSLCYQLPPLVTGRPTLVISPLIALMKDQVDALTLLGYPAAALHSQTTGEEDRAREAMIEDGSLRLLYTSPERALAGGLIHRIADRLGGFGALAIDEAHCISQWGHDFRPEYRRIAELRRSMPQVPTHAFTATATPRVREDIAAQLELRAPAVLVGSFDRPNLVYRVIRKHKPMEQIAEAIARHPGEGAIVYCLSRSDADQTALGLRARGVDAAAYHAGLDAAERAKVQDRFVRERIDVVCATVAFGMGIDRSNVRLVVHQSMPKSVEAYQQEAGRAGRDGLAAECVLLYSAADAARWAELIRRSAEDAGIGEELIRAQLQLLAGTQRFAASLRCRHRQLVNYFGQELDGDNCGACDVCLGETEIVPEGQLVARKILSCVARCEQRFGAGHIASVLKGTRSDRIVEYKHHQLSTFGLLSGMSKGEIAGFIDQLIDQGALERVGEPYPTLRLGERGLAIMRNETEAVLSAPRGTSAAARARVTTTTEVRPLEDGERAVFEAMRALRKSIAEERGVPPYVVFSDATLRELAKARPDTLGAMSRIKGVGPAKLEAFGEDFLAVIAEHLPA